MLDYKKINKYLGFGVGVFASVIYIISSELSVSFWDCGEYVASASKVQNPHPPGNPFFVLVGRFFVLLFGDNPKNTAIAVNSLSAISSGATIMFLFWITTFFAKKIILCQNTVVNNKEQQELSLSQILTVIFSGLISSLSFTFTDTFWFNAVGGEVYALSHFLLVLVFYLMIVWSEKEDSPNSDRYLVVIFLTIGMSVCIHLLDLLVIPALAMVFYYKKYKNPTTKGAVLAFIIGCAIIGVVMFGVLQYTLVFAAKMDLLFVNTFSLPIFTGFITFFVLLLGLTVRYLFWSIKKGKYYLQLGIWCFLMVMLGYSTYTVTLIRSNADVSIDMNSPEDPLSFLNYILRLQYGDKPLIYGPVFTAGQTEDNQYQPEVVEDKEIFSKKKDENGKWVYAKSGVTQKYEYQPEDNIIFPRIWQTNEDGRNSKNFYANWLGIKKIKNQETNEEFFERKATFSDNIKWFLSYQLGWMYLRYFMWNFVGRQNDIQGFGDPRDGNAITGIDLIDNVLLKSEQKYLPDSLKNHESHNTLFAIPFILGLIGLIYHFKKDRYNFIINVVFFFFTGIAIVLYLNDTGPQPRERDYSHAVSFLSFAVWIGISFIPISEAINRYLKKRCIALVATFMLMLTCPVLLAIQEWDDHNRGNKTLPRDYAIAMLGTCPKNAVLVTFGDNDTYPLWYIQEVEGYRKDVRIVNSSLLGIDWYINQLRYKVNESDSLDLIFSSDQVFGSVNDYIFVNPMKEIEGGIYDLYDILKNFVSKEDDRFKIPIQNGEKVNFFPTNKFAVKLNKDQLLKNGIVDSNHRNYIEDRIMFELPKKVVYKSDLIILSIIASSFNKRAILFSSEYKDLGFGDYLQKSGLLYQLVPYKAKSKESENNINIESSLKLAYNIDLGKLRTQKIYFDETNRQQLLSIREFYSELAAALLSDGRKGETVKLLKQMETVIPYKFFPYGMVSRYNSHNRMSLAIMQTAYSSGYKELAYKIYDQVKKDLTQQKLFYRSMKNRDDEEDGGYEEYYNSQLLKSLEEVKWHTDKNKENKGVLR